MTTKESQQTKYKLDQNKDAFKNLVEETTEKQDRFRKKLYQEIVQLDQKQNKMLQRRKERKRILAMKSQVGQVYSNEEDDDIEIPVDGEVKAGSMVFMKNCSTCHSLEAVDGRPMKGPSLGLIYNRRAGSNVTYQQYTNQVLRSGLFWTPKNLYIFMGKANSLFPKTTCKLRTHPLAREQDRADLLTLFKQFTKEMMFNIRLKEIQEKGFQAFQTGLYTEKQQIERGRMRAEGEKNKERKI